MIRTKHRVLFSLDENRNHTIKEKLTAGGFEAEFVKFDSSVSVESFDLVIPLRIQDIEYLNEHQHHLNGHRFLTPSPGVVRIADDKKLFNEHLRRHAWEQCLPANAHPGDFPYVIKRRKDAGGAHSFLVRNRDDEVRHQSLWIDPDYFAQKYVPGHTEYTVHFIYRNGMRFLNTLEFRMNREWYIRGKSMQPYQNVQIREVTTCFVGLFESILSSLDYQGIGCFNFKIVDGRPVIFELNPRLGGSLHHGLKQMLNNHLQLLKPIRGLQPADFMQSHLNLPIRRVVSMPVAFGP